MALAGSHDSLRRRFVPNSFDPIVLVVALLEVGPLIGPFIRALGHLEARGYAPVRTWLKIPNLQFPRVDQREGWRLHPPDRRNIPRSRAEESFRDRARPIDPDQPIAFAARACGVGQALHLGAIAEVLEAISDSLRRHRL